MYAPAHRLRLAALRQTGMEQASDVVLSGDDNRLFSTRLSDLLTGRDPRGGDVS